MRTDVQYTPFRLPANFWRQSRGYIFLLVLNGFGRALAVTGVFYSVRQAVRSLQQAQAPETSMLWVLLLMAGVLLGARLHERYTAEKMSQNYINRLRRRLLARLMRVSIRDVNSIPAGALAARLGGDLSALRRWLSLGVSRLIVNAILLLASIGIITSISLVAGLVTGLVIVLLAAVSLKVGEHLRTVLKAVRSTRIRLQSLLVERIGEMAMIRAMGQEKREIRKINKLGWRLKRQASTQGLFLGGLRGLGEAGGILLIISVFSVFRISGEMMTAADAAAIISLVMFMTGPVRELGRVQEYYRGATISLHKLSALFNMRRIARGASLYADSRPEPGVIEFRNVYCAPAIKNFSGRVAAGERVAVIGQNGSGKSTLLQLAIGLLKPDSGRVRLSGIDPRRLSPSDRSECIGITGSGFGLLRGSLDFNLAYRRPTTPGNELHVAASKFELQRLIEKIDEGRSGRIQQAARNISAGERARIGLVRATLGEPEVLILDEPESNLDADGLRLLHELLECWSGTVFLITHKQSLIKLCNKIWDLDAEDNQSDHGNVTRLATR